MNSQICYIDFDKIDGNSLNRMDNAYIQINQDILDMQSKYPILNMKKIIKEFQKGKTPLKGALVEEGRYPFVSVENINNNFIDKDSISIFTNNIYDNLPVANKGDILIVVDGSIGKTAVYIENNPCHYIESLAKLVLNEEQMDKEYFILFTKSDLFKKEVKGFGTFLAIPHLPQENIKRMVIPLPPLSEQRRTVPFVKRKIGSLEEKINKLEEEKEKNSLQNIVDRVFEEELGIEKPKYEIDNYNKLVDINSCMYYKSFNTLTDELDFLLNTYFSIIKDLLDRYSCVKLEDLLEIPLCMGGSVKKTDKETGYYRIMVKNLSSNNENMKIDDIDNISINDYKKSNEKNVLKHGDILFSASGAGCIGNIVINNTDLKAIIDNHVGILRLQDKKLALFIYYYLNSYLGKQQIFRCVTGTTGQISINMGKMSKILVPNLTQSKRNKIISKIETYKGNKRKANNKINKLQSIIDDDLNKYVLYGYSDDLFQLPEEVR